MAARSLADREGCVFICYRSSAKPSACHGEAIQAKPPGARRAPAGRCMYAVRAVVFAAGHGALRGDRRALRRGADDARRFLRGDAPPRLLGLLYEREQPARLPLFRARRAAALRDPLPARADPACRVRADAVHPAHAPRLPSLPRAVPLGAYALSAALAGSAPRAGGQRRAALRRPADDAGLLAALLAGEMAA